MLDCRIGSWSHIGSFLQLLLPPKERKADLTFDPLLIGRATVARGDGVLLLNAFKIDTGII